MKNQAADTLSRLLNTGLHNSGLEDQIHVMVIAKTESHDKGKNSTVPKRTQKTKLIVKNSEGSDDILPSLSGLITA